MIVVIFELEPHPEQAQRYFNLAEDLKAGLTQQEGFISIERFHSISLPGRYLSLSVWRDEQSVRNWRNLAEHRMAQGEGRTRIFSDYRLRVAHVLRDYGMFERVQAPSDSTDALR
ncbi:antibiotic biosynthesis monooxygenase [Aquabacterium soli]|jgi:heme-degrading monooxygenase HmoA|uniref:Antibiotic biosynthesis monooxygenase n=1 Tax=Aquabacterium soli TaxID=2493092 RepID=A0A3R8S7W9_9BURK|nr:antibiotic biosynthesis monooxygenase [Aquabacterium soli]RRS04505.1 antibiotic biosynthesis monooxygenase [Aquabacterium soli]